MIPAVSVATDRTDLERLNRAVESLVWTNAQQTAEEMHDPLRGTPASPES